MGRDRRLRIEQRDAHAFEGTATTWRRFEIACIVAVPFMWLHLLARTWGSFKTPGLTVLAVLTGYLTADLISGSFHWFFDTWFSPNTPFIGRTFVRTFREHHVDPTAICRHDFVETNGSNIFAGGVLIIAGDCASSAFGAISMLSAAVFMSLTSQIHKWAHAERVPRLVALFQRTHIFLSKRAHDLHHVAPFDRSYCITSGWLNAPLHYTRFFRVVERVITVLSGALPRHDDIGVEAAAVVAEIDIFSDDVHRDAGVVVTTSKERFVDEGACDFGCVVVDAPHQR